MQYHIDPVLGSHLWLGLRKVRVSSDRSHMDFCRAVLLIPVMLITGLLIGGNHDGQVLFESAIIVNLILLNEL